MSSSKHDQSRRLSSEDQPPSDGGGSWNSTIWGISVVVIGFVAIQAFRHFNDTARPQPQEARFVTADERQSLLDNGVSVNLVIRSCSEEYAGHPYGDLNLTKQDADIESVVTIGGKSKTATSKSANRKPNQDVGEADRCRLVFDDDGRVFLNTHQKITVGGPDVLTVTASYELEIVEGSRADYEAGRLIRLIYKQEALEKRRDDLKKSLALQWMPILRREVPGDSTMNFNMKCVVEPLPQSSMRATPSSLFIEDGGPVKATITVTVSER